MTTQLQVRRDTAANWTSANPTLLAGEIGFETDTGRFKIGTGATAWASLPYGTANLAAPPAIGATTANTGRFSDLTDTGLTSGRVTYATTGGNLTDSANLTFDGTTLTTNVAAATTVTATVGAGFQNMVVYTTGSSASWSLPTALRVAGAKFKVTIVGGGGQGGGTAATAGHTGNGGGSGAVCIAYITYAAGQNTLTYTVGTGGSGAGTNATGNNGNASSVVYNSVTYTANGGSGGATSGTNNGGGAGGTATGGTLNIDGYKGDSGGVSAATAPYMGYGAMTPMGFGGTPISQGAAATGTGIAGTGYGSGGSGGKNGATATARAGGAGAGGIVIIEY